MTKLREPLTYQHTLTKVAALIGWDRCGAICGVSAKSVRNWSDPDCETEIRMIDADRLDRAFVEHGGDYRPFHTLMDQRFDLDAFQARDACMILEAAQVAKESGEAISALLQAATSNDPNARREALREGEELLATVIGALATLRRGCNS